MRMKGTGKSVKKRKKDSDLKENVVFNIQSIIMSVLMAITLVTIVTMGFLLYQRFKLAIDKMAVSNTEATVESTVDRVNSDLLDIRQIFDAANYNIVQEFDISSEKFAEQFSLLYEVNSDKIESLALYGNEGRLIASEPVAVEKENIDVKGQDWYKNAESAIENVHFSIPHIQNLYEDGLYRYHWVVSLSRYVDINDGEIPGSGVLLVDMKYSVIEDVLKQINDSSEGIYYYMISRDGQMIYHPRKTEMARGLIGVVPESVQTARINNFRYYIFTTIMVLMMMLLEGNRLISRKISKPIRKLDESVKTYEAGGKTDIYIGGSSEIRHLGYSVQRSYERIETLMEEIIRQQNERRKSELDALQSQINPHFLLNTLNSIQWMARMSHQDNITEFVQRLKKLLSYNLGKEGMQTTLRTEIDIVKEYIALQQMRYDFVIEMNVEEGSYLEQPTVRMLLQPLVENAIQYGLGKDEKITMRIFEDNRRGLAAITIADSGNGLTIEEINQINAPFDYNLQKMQNGNRGIGLRYVKAMLDSFYEGQTNLFVNCKKGHGTKITILIPVQEELRDKAKVTDTGIE